MEIKRDLYLNQLIARKRNGLIKVITGVRRCGKSYLLNSIFYRHLLAEGVDPDHIIRFAPPLCINKEELMEAIGIIKKTFEQMFG